MGVSATCSNRITVNDCHRGAHCVFVMDTGECLRRNQSILAYTRCEAHHLINTEQGTSSDRPSLAVVQACVNDSLCDWDNFRERCVPLRNLSCPDSSAQLNASECRSRVGCYWQDAAPVGQRCTAFAWDGETKCSTANDNATLCASLGTHRGSCHFETTTALCRAYLDTDHTTHKPQHTSYAWRAYCAHSNTLPLTGTANATECATRGEWCAVTYEPLSLDLCTPAGQSTLAWCDTLQTEPLCDLYSYCYYAIGSSLSSSPLGPLTRGCFARSPAHATDGYRDDWAPFVSDIRVVQYELDSLFVRLEASIVVPQCTSDQGDAADARLWDAFVVHANASSPNHWIHGLSGALGPVGGNTSDSNKYPTYAVLRAALRTATATSHLAMNMYPLLYTYTGRQFEHAHEFEGRNTMAIRVAASIPRAELELSTTSNDVDDSSVGSYFAFSWNVSAHAVNQSTAFTRVWRIRSVVSDTGSQAHTLVSVDDVNVVGNTSLTPVASVSVDPTALEFAEWLEFQHVHNSNSTTMSHSSAFSAPVVLRSVASAHTSSSRVGTLAPKPRGLVPWREVDWLYTRHESATAYGNASAATGYTHWWRRTHTASSAPVDMFVAMNFVGTFASTVGGIEVPWVDTQAVDGQGIQLLLKKRWTWRHHIVDPWWRAQIAHQQLGVLQNANATVWLRAVNATNHVVAGPLALDNTRVVTKRDASGAAAVEYRDANWYTGAEAAVTNTSLYSDWWDSLNDLSQVALGSAVDAVPVVTTTYVDQNHTLQVSINASALSYWLVPWFATHGLKLCFSCTFRVSYTLEIPTPLALNASAAALLLLWDTLTPLAAGQPLRYVHNSHAAIHDDLIVLVSHAEALTKERMSHSAAVWAIVIWICAVIFVVGAILLSRRPTKLPQTEWEEMRARLVLADKQQRDALKAKHDALRFNDATNPLSDNNIVDIQDGGIAPPAILALEPDTDAAAVHDAVASSPPSQPEEVRAQQVIRQRLVNAMRPQGYMSSRLAKS